MKKSIPIAIVSLLAVSLLSGCAGPAQPAAAQKPAVNFEGVVTAVDGGSVTLEDGTTVLITDGTVFAGDPDTANAVSADIAVGNFLQGYTADDVNAAQITAGNIWTNRPKESAGGKMAVNFEGRVTQAEAGTVTLDNGKIIRISEETDVTAPDGSPADIAVGDYIQGYAGDPEGSEIDALHVLMTVL